MGQQQSQVLDIMLGNKVGDSRWKGGQGQDLAGLTYNDNDGWFIRHNAGRIDAGTFGWIHQYNGSHGHLAGALAFDSRPQLYLDDDGKERWYCTGSLFPFPRSWWVLGDRIAAEGWPDDRSPYGKNVPAQFANGVSIGSDIAGIIESLLPGPVGAWRRDIRPPTAR